MIATSTPHLYTQMKGRDFITIKDFTPEEISYLLDLATDLKQKKQTGLVDAPLAGKILAMIFDKPSTRTRVSFEVGMAQLGGYAMNLSSQDIQLGRGETIEDTARVLSRYVDAILIRTYNHQHVLTLADSATVPVINGLTDLFHPCQILSDLLTLKEEKGTLHGLKLTYVGDSNNVLHSLIHGAAATGLHLAVSTPIGYEPLPEVWQDAERIAVDTGATLTYYNDPFEAVQQADAIYTDVWASMGQEEEKAIRMEAFQGYQVNGQMLSLAKKDAIFMHCLPAYRGLEVAAEVIDGPQSVVFNQAENRLHAQKALLLSLLS